MSELRSGVSLEELHAAADLYLKQQASTKRLLLALEDVEDRALEQHKATVAQVKAAIDRQTLEQAHELAEMGHARAGWSRIMTATESGSAKSGRRHSRHGAPAANHPRIVSGRNPSAIHTIH